MAAGTPRHADGLPLPEGVSEAEARRGFALFFMNDAAEALAFFERHSDIPLYALGHAAVLFVKAALTMEPTDRQTAFEQIARTEALLAEATAALSPASTVASSAAAAAAAISSFGRWLTGRRGGGDAAAAPEPTPEEVAARAHAVSQEVHLKVMASECRLMYASLLVLEESLMDKMTGAYNMSRAWRAFSALEKEYGPGAPKAFAQLDPECAAGLLYGCAVFNLVCSALPERIRKLASMFGFPTDRDKALRLLGEVGGVRAPLAKLALLSHYLILGQMLPVDEEIFLDRAVQLAHASLEHYENGGLFVLAKARASRLKRQLQQAISEQRLAYSVHADYLQLQHFSEWELAWLHCCLGQHREARDSFLVLYRDSNWSKAFCGFMAALCHLELGELDEAHELLAAVPALCNRRFVGKMIAAEEYVFKKLNTPLALSPVGLLEALYLFNCFGQLEKPTIAALVAQLEALLQAAGSRQGAGKAAAQGHSSDAGADAARRIRDTNDINARLASASSAASSAAANEAGSSGRSSGRSTPQPPPCAARQFQPMLHLLLAALLIELEQHERALAELDAAEQALAAMGKTHYGIEWVPAHMRWERAVIAVRTQRPVDEVLALVKSVSQGSGGYAFELRLTFKAQQLKLHLKQERKLREKEGEGD